MALFMYAASVFHRDLHSFPTRRSSDLESGLEVAARIRATVESAGWRWGGEEYPMTISCGVASYPDAVTQLDNLRSAARNRRSEEHTSELQSHVNPVCRLLPEKKKRTLI